MTDLPFVKMQGTGNDYVFIDGFEVTLPADPELVARRVSDRHRGIGSDGLVYLLPPTSDSANVEMKMWNVDGSPGAMCGNAARCVAVWMQRTGRCGSECRIRMGTRTLLAEILRPLEENFSKMVRIEMGQPEFPSGTDTVEFDDVSFPDGRAVTATLVSLGNPHAVVFVEQITDDLVEKLGPALESHSRFPDRTNVEFVRRLSNGSLSVRVWERGSGETQACGSGACAAAVAALTQQTVNRCTQVDVRLPGGTLTVAWDRESGVKLTGEATVVFTGVLL